MSTDTQDSIDTLINKSLTGDKLKQFCKIYYGKEEHQNLALKSSTYNFAKNEDIDISGYRFPADIAETRSPRLIKIGLVQNSIVLATTESVENQRKAIFEKIESYIKIAANEGVNILCLQECWSMPFFLCTREKGKWLNFSESTWDGPSILFLKEFARMFGMVIVSPILEKDSSSLWNTAVIINEYGKVIGKTRKNHLPSTGSFSETSYYKPGNLGHPVFETKFGKIAVNICYGRHIAQNWLMYALNGAEIVFNPAATIAEFGESFWRIEARTAAVANNYFTCSINRVGTEIFCQESGNKTLRSYYGSSYVSAPDGSMTPALSRSKDGILITEIDLNLCRQVKDKWGFHMTRRMDLYASELNNHVKSTF